MNSPLTTFLESCPQGEGAVCKVLEFVRAFHRTLSSAERVVWTRTRIVAQMGKLGFDLGTDSERRANFVGVALPVCVVDGRLTVVAEPSGIDAAGIGAAEDQRGQSGARSSALAALRQSRVAEARVKTGWENNLQTGALSALANYRRLQLLWALGVKRGSWG